MGLTYFQNYFDLRKNFVFYGAYHNERRNQLVHVVWVPVIFTTALGFCSKLAISSRLNLSHAVAAVYAGTFIAMEPVAGLLYAPAIFGMRAVGQYLATHFMGLCVALHLIGWALQIVAHKYFEHRKPAFLEDPLQAIHSAVFFVWLEVLFYLGYRPEEKRELDALVAARIAKMDVEEAASTATSKAKALIR